MRLYHGSKSGLEGPIRPMSRDRCDFGRGFYMGTEERQPLTLICNFERPVLYTLELCVDGLDVLELSAASDWAMLVAYCRGKLDGTIGSPLYGRMASIEASYDVIAGPIANDRMFVVLDRFFNGEITDAALVACLSALSLGDQYVAKTDRACQAVSVVDERMLKDVEIDALIKQSAAQREEGIARAERICREHRREGLFFDELLEAGL